MKKQRGGPKKPIVTEKDATPTPPKVAALKVGIILGMILLVAFLLFSIMYYATGGKAAYDKVKQMKKQQKTAEGEAQGPTPVPQLEVTHKVFFDVSSGDQPLGKIVMGLFGKNQPKTVENFVGLSTHKNAFGYKNTIFHRVIKNFVLQGGDFERRDGTGGKTFDGKDHLADEDLTVPHFKYCLSMANRGPNTSASQFFITTGETSWLNGKHVVFGKILEGFDVISKIENSPVSKDFNKPLKDIVITNAGLM